MPSGLVDVSLVWSFETCPRCGAPTYHGHGLAFGGYGPYTCCDSGTSCQWFVKALEHDDGGWRDSADAIEYALEVMGELHR